MTLHDYLDPESLRSRSEWEDAMLRFEFDAERYLRVLPSGTRYFDPDMTPGPVLEVHNALQVVGLEHGWIDGYGDEMELEAAA